MDFQENVTRKFAHKTLCRNVSSFNQQFEENTQTWQLTVAA